MLSLEFFPIRAHQTSDSPRSTIEIHSLAVWLQSPYSSPCRRETSPAFESEPRASLPTPADPPFPFPGLLLRPPRHPKQTLPKQSQHHPRPLLGSPSRLLRRLPARLPRPRQLDPAPLRLQSDFHLGPLLIRRRIARRLALHLV